MIERMATIQVESDRLGQVLAGCPADQRVPSCPDWSARDLLSHCVTVQRFWARVIGDRLDAEQVQEYERDRERLPDDFGELLELRPAATADLVAALTGRDPAEPAWSWFPPDQTVGFTQRMQLHEATVHRVDAELTAGGPVSRIAPEVAEDALDHLLDVMWNWTPPDARRRVTGTVELRATDTGSRRVLQLFRWTGEAFGTAVTDQIGCGRAVDGADSADGAAVDALAAGTAQQLELYLWGRTDGDVTRSGDEGALAELRAMRDDGTG